MALYLNAHQVVVAARTGRLAATLATRTARVVVVGGGARVCGGAEAGHLVSARVRGYGWGLRVTGGG